MSFASHDMSWLYHSQSHPFTIHDELMEKGSQTSNTHVLRFDYSWDSACHKDLLVQSLFRTSRLLSSSISPHSFALVLGLWTNRCSTPDGLVNQRRHLSRRDMAIWWAQSALTYRAHDFPLCNMVIFEPRKRSTRTPETGGCRGCRVKP